ncbi:hypothetical protein AAZX31_01G090200 [Glycine max]
MPNISFPLPLETITMNVEESFIKALYLVTLLNFTLASWRPLSLTIIHFKDKPTMSSQTLEVITIDFNTQIYIHSHHQYGKYCRKLLPTLGRMCPSSLLTSSTYGTQEVQEG